MISPSEKKGIALGLSLLQFDRAKRVTMIDGKSVKTSVYARFESPPIYPPARTASARTAMTHRTHVLHSYAKSRAGAWRHAIRWLRQLQKGKLT